MKNKYSLKIIFNENIIVEAKSSAKSAASTAKGIYAEYMSAQMVADKYGIQVTNAKGTVVDAKGKAKKEKTKYEEYMKKDASIPPLKNSDLNGKDPAENQYKVLLKAIADVEKKDKTFKLALKNKDARIECVGQSPNTEIAQEDLRIRWPLKGSNPNYLLFSSKAGSSSIKRATTSAGQLGVSIAEKASESMVSQLFDFIETQAKKSEEQKIALDNVKKEYGLKPTDKLKSKNGKLDRNLPYSSKLFPAMSSALAANVLKKISAWSAETAAEQLQVVFKKYYKDSDIKNIVSSPPKYYYGIKNSRSDSRLVKMSEVHGPMMLALNDVFNSGAGVLGYVPIAEGDKTLIMTHNGKELISFGIDCGISGGKFRLNINLLVRDSKPAPKSVSFSGKSTEKKEEAFKVEKEEIKKAASESIDALVAAAMQRASEINKEKIPNAIEFQGAEKFNKFFQKNKRTGKMPKTANIKPYAAKELFMSILNVKKLNSEPRADLSQALADKGWFKYFPKTGGISLNAALLKKNKLPQDVKSFTAAVIETAKEIGIITESTQNKENLIIERWNKLAGLIK